jgi:hypothetical protein
MRRLLFLATTLAATSTARADVDPRITDAIAKLKPSDYPSANVVAVVADESIVYQPDGQFVDTQHDARLALTTEGKSEIASVSVPYTKDSGRVDVLVARVIKKDGRIVDVDKKDIQDTEQSGEENMYDPNGRAVKITLSNVAVGDVVETTWRLTRTTPTRPGFFDTIFTFQSTEPLLASSLSIDGPAKLPLTAQIYHRDRAPKIEETKTAAGDRIHYKWTISHAAQLVPEMAMNYTSELPVLIVTTDPSWQHFSKWWSELTAPQLVATQDIKDKVKELTKDAKTDDDKIKALYNFVSQDIRYRGLGVGPRTGYTPRKASETLTSRWGVCRDVAVLLTSMLRESGLDAYPVLTNAGDPVLPKVAYEGFNHAIVAMPTKTGGWRYLDPTAKNNTSLLPGNEAEQDTLVATPKGEGLTRTPALEPAANRGHAIAETTIRPDGSMTSKVKFETKGIFDLALRSAAAMLSEEQVRQAIEELMHHALPDARIVSVKLSNALSLFEPMTISTEIEVANAAPKTGEYRLARTLVTSGALGLVEQFLPQVLGALPTRKFGLDAHVTFEYDEDETVSMPAETKVIALPNSAKVSNRVSDVAAECKQNSSTQVTCHRSFQLKSRFIDPEQYKALRAALAALGQIAHQPVILAGGK